MIAAINPSKTLQKPLEAILKPSKGFSLSVAHQRARTQSRGSTLTACGRATLDRVKRHPHPRGCSSFRVAPSGSAEDGERGKAPNLGQGTSPLWGAGAKPLALIHAQTSLWSVRSYRDIRGIWAKNSFKARVYKALIAF